MVLPVPVIVDADVLIRNVEYAVRKHYAPALLGKASPNYSLFSGIVLFATSQVRREAIRHLPDIAERRAVDLDAIHAVWNDLIVPNLRFVELATNAVDDPRIARVHPDDAPTAALAALLAPAVLATDNRKHFRSLGLPDTNTDAVAKDLFALGEFGIGATGATLFPTLAGAATIEGSKKVVAKIGADAAALIGLLVLGGIVLFLMSERGHNLRVRLVATGRQVGPPLTDLLAHVAEASERVSAFAVERVGKLDARSAIARRLAVGQSVMATREVVDELRLQGFGFGGSRGFDVETRAWLEREPCFCEVKRGRWTLGYHGEEL